MSTMATKPLDRHAVRELELYAANDYATYQMRDVYLANMRRRMKKGTYNSTLGVKLWEYYADRAARAYAKDILRSPSEWSKMFPKNVRHEAAKSFEAEAREELRGG